MKGLPAMVEVEVKIVVVLTTTAVLVLPPETASTAAVPETVM